MLFGSKCENEIRAFGAHEFRRQSGTSIDQNYVDFAWSNTLEFELQPIYRDAFDDLSRFSRGLWNTRCMQNIRVIKIANFSICHLCILYTILLLSYILAANICINYFLLDGYPDSSYPLNYLQLHSRCISILRTRNSFKIFTLGNDLIYDSHSSIHTSTGTAGETRPAACNALAQSAFCKDKMKWTKLKILKCELRQKHKNSQFPLRWIYLVCFFKWSRRPKRLPHVWHGNGRCPVWMRLCLVSSSLRVNVFPQLGSSHLNGRSPVWIRMCPFNWPLLENATSQCGHLNFFGRCLRAVIAFTCASSASTRAYSCSMVNGSTGTNGMPGIVLSKSWYDGGAVGV